MGLEIAKVVEVKALTKRVDNGGEPLTILHENSFAVAAGETVAIVGASGSGKSTLLGLLAGLDLPSSGSVTLAGELLGALDEDARAVLRGRHIVLELSCEGSARRALWCAVGTPFPRQDGWARPWPGITVRCTTISLWRRS